MPESEPRDLAADGLKMSGSGALPSVQRGGWDVRKCWAKRLKKDGWKGTWGGCRKQKYTAMLPLCHPRHQWDGDTGKDRKYHWHSQHNTALAHSSLIIAYWAARPDALGTRASVTDGKGCQASPPPKKGVLKLIRAPSKAAGKVLTCRETRVTWWQLHWTLGLIYIFLMASAVSESLIEAIASVCWVKVASFALGKCRVAAILTLLWCYFEEGLRRIARAFSGQSSY